MGKPLEGSATVTSGAWKASALALVALGISMADSAVIGGWAIASWGKGKRAVMMLMRWQCIARGTPTQRGTKHTLQMDQNVLRRERQQQQRGMVDDVKYQVSFAICLDDARVSRMARRRFINKASKRLVGYLL